MYIVLFLLPFAVSLSPSVMWCILSSSLFLFVGPGLGWNSDRTGAGSRRELGGCGDVWVCGWGDRSCGVVGEQPASKRLCLGGRARMAVDRVWCDGRVALWLSDRSNRGASGLGLGRARGLRFWWGKYNCKCQLSSCGLVAGALTSRDSGKKNIS